MKYLKKISGLLTGVLCFGTSTAFAAENEIIKQNTFLEDLEKQLSEFDITKLDSKLGLKGLGISDKIYLSKENVFVIILAVIVLVALCIVLISVSAARKSRIRQLERDKKELKIREEALLEEKRRRIANRQRTIDSRRTDASRRQLVEVLKKVAERKKYDDLMKQQDILLEEQPWLRADRD